MEGGFSTGATGGEVAQEGIGAELGTGTVANTGTSEGLTTEDSAKTKFVGYDEFDMESEDEGELSEEENQDAEYKADSVDFLLQSDFFSEEEAVEFQAEIDQYSELARQHGISPEAFNNIVNHFIMNEMEIYAQEVEAEEKQTENALQNLKKELTLSERQSWKPLKAELTEILGTEKAKTIMLDADLYRAYLNLKQGKKAVEPLIKTVPVKKMSQEQVMDKRTGELKANLGNDEKIAEIFKRYENEYPEYFKNK